jgi:hypothetical protein
MTNMQCHQLEQVLEQQDAGPLPEAAVAHIDACEACRTLAADLRAIHDAAIELGAEEISPSEYVWVSVRKQLEAEGIIHEPRPAPRSMKQGWWFVFQRPALAGAFLSLVVFAASLISFRGNPGQTAMHPQFAFERHISTVPSAESVFREELLTVGKESIPGFQIQDAAVMDCIRRDLGIVDNFIAMSEKSVREQPDNEMAREYLYGAYQQKAELLATAMDHSMTGGLP